MQKQVQASLNSQNLHYIFVTLSHIEVFLNSSSYHIKKVFYHLLSVVLLKLKYLKHNTPVINAVNFLHCLQNFTIIYSNKTFMLAQTFFFYGSFTVSSTESLQQHVLQP